jgi:hypothetical protein
MTDCYGELIDGHWYTNSCPCEDCEQAEIDRVEHLIEMGELPE